MSFKDGRDYLYLIWKSSLTRHQYIVGQLTKNGQYEFQYCEEIEDALKAGFKPLVSFEKLDAVYRGKELFPVFSSRLPDPKRKDIEKILRKYGLEEYDSYQLLKKSGARLPIDNLQFIDPILNFESGFEKTFCLAGARHYLGCDGKSCSGTVLVTRGDEVFLKREMDNLYDTNAICVIDKQQRILGYIPRYYSQAFARFIEEKRNLECHIANVGKDAYCDECIGVSVKVSGLKESDTLQQADGSL